MNIRIGVRKIVRWIAIGALLPCGIVAMAADPQLAQKPATNLKSDSGEVKDALKSGPAGGRNAAPIGSQPQRVGSVPVEKIEIGVKAGSPANPKSFNPKGVEPNAARVIGPQTGQTTAGPRPGTKGADGVKWEGPDFDAAKKKRDTTPK